jgi:hypothetical protein
VIENRKLGELLVQSGKITPEQLKTALEYHESIGGQLGAILVKLGFVTDDEIVRQVAQQKSISTFDLEANPPDPEVVKSIRVDILQKHCAIPVKLEDGTLTVAMANPEDFEAIEEIEFVSDASVEVVLAARAAIQRALNKILFPKGAPDPSPAPEPPPAPAAPRVEDKPVSTFDTRRALIPLLIEKGLITEEELIRKARELS